MKSLTSQSDIMYVENSCINFSKSSIRTLPILLLKILKLRKERRTVLSPEAVVNNAVIHELNKLQRGMGILLTSANISPLIGLLGTVWGIMSSFINIHKMGSASIATVAPGIAEALITTIAGLCVAIPAMIGHNFLTLSINQCMDSIDRVSEYAMSMFSREIKS